MRARLLLILFGLLVASPTLELTQEVYGMTPFQITTAEKDIYHDTELDCIALLYYGTGAAACKAYPNCILVAACNPGDANCPAFNIQ